MLDMSKKQYKGEDEYSESEEEDGESSFESEESNQG